MRSLRVPLVLALALALTLPILVLAQEDEMHATVRAAIMQDPRTQGMSQEQIDAMVNLLADHAQQQGVTPQDITWRPADTSATPVAACAGLPQFFCTFSEAFGFSGPYFFIALALGASAAFLLFVIGMILHHRGHHVTGPFVAQPR